MTCRVLTLNVLSPYLVSEMEPVPDNEERKKKLLLYLETVCAEKYIIGLQEVCVDWAKELRPFFEARGYFSQASLYGDEASGGMGLLIAYPSSRYSGSVFEERLSAEIASVMHNFPDKKEERMIMSRPNTVLTARLEDTASKHKFCVTICHLPCKWEHCAAMSTFALGVKYIFFKHLDADYRHGILMGDFNLQPGRRGFKLLPSTFGGRERVAFTSADPLIYEMGKLKDAMGKRHPHTNAAKYRGQNFFAAPLDYILTSENVDALSCEVPKFQYGTPFLEQGHFSDHLPVTAELKFL